jgi:aspartokinase-like uncharacterized kinase
MSAPAYDALIKVGGSLERGSPEGTPLRELCVALAELARRHRLLVVPGGGRFADAVREAARRHPLGEDAAHWMAILGMEQYGYLLAALTPGGTPVRDLDAAWRAAARGATPILLPFELLSRHDPLPHSWEVTSDSIAAWLCGVAPAQRLVLLKDVDGLYDRDPRQGAGATLHEEVSAAQVGGLGGVDGYLPRLLRDLRAEAWVLNGTVPRRLAALLDGAQGRVRGTVLARWEQGARAAKDEAR